MFTLKIETDNAAFSDGRGAELARILRKLADKIEDADARGDKGKVMDYNGNSVGTWELL